MALLGIGAFVQFGQFVVLTCRCCCLEMHDADGWVYFDFVIHHIVDFGKFCRYDNKSVSFLLQAKKISDLVAQNYSVVRAASLLPFPVRSGDALCHHHLLCLKVLLQSEEETAGHAGHAGHARDINGERYGRALRSFARCFQNDGYRSRVVPAVDAAVFHHALAEQFAFRFPKVFHPHFQHHHIHARDRLAAEISARNVDRYDETVLGIAVSDLPLARCGRGSFSL